MIDHNLRRCLRVLFTLNSKGLNSTVGMFYQRFLQGQPPLFGIDPVLLGYIAIIFKKLL